MKTDVIHGVPDWATTYLMYGDDSGLSPKDRAAVKAFEASIHSSGLRLVSPIDGSENEFRPEPAFGLACATVDWLAVKTDRR